MHREIGYLYFTSNLKPTQKTNNLFTMKKLFTLVSVFSIYTTGIWAQATPNPGFENWTTQGFPSYSTPDNWDNPNSQTAITGIFVVVKATAAADIHSGSAAVKLITKNVLATDAPGIVTTGTLPTSTGNPITGGIPYTLRPDSIIGWYKYTSVSGDNGFFAFALLGSGGDTDTIGKAFWQTPASNVGTYTRFSKEITYLSANPVVKSVWVACSSNSGTAAIVGSTLYADDLGLVINPTTNVTEEEQMYITVTPNPAADQVVIRTTSGLNAVFVLSDITGRKIAEEKITGIESIISLNTFPGGAYFYSVTDENKRVIKTGKLTIQK